MSRLVLVAQLSVLLFVGCGDVHRVCVAANSGEVANVGHVQFHPNHMSELVLRLERLRISVEREFIASKAAPAVQPLCSTVLPVRVQLNMSHARLRHLTLQKSRHDTGRAR